MKQLMLVLGLTLSLSLQVSYAEKAPADQLAEIGTEATAAEDDKAAKKAKDAEKKAAEDTETAATWPTLVNLH
jgi:hypothetical protein